MLVDPQHRGRTLVCRDEIIYPDDDLLFFLDSPLVLVGAFGNFVLIKLFLDCLNRSAHALDRLKIGLRPGFDGIRQLLDIV